jgi:hypothetical protein
MPSTNYALGYTCLLFALVVHMAKADPVYHAASLALLCISIVRHWAAQVTPAIAWTDRLVAHACYLLAAHTHLVQHPNAPGAACLATVLALWVSEHRVADWALLHAPMHAVAAAGLALAVHRRSLG